MQPEHLTKDRTTPLVLVHGAWHGAWCWEEHFVPFFRRAGFAVHTLNLREHGDAVNRGRLRWVGIADYVRDVAALTASLGAPPVLVGHSMGGLVVQKYLERHPAAAGVLLASVPPAGALATTLRIARRRPKAFLKANATLSLYPFVETPELAREHFFSATMPREQVLTYFRRLQDESYRAFLDMLAFQLPRPRRVSAPMLVLGGADDTIFRPYEVRATARAYRTTATIFPDMAHDMMLERGWQAVAEAILGWLASVG
jgi:pimeloyl-ACP methyl ester carboxylesterase